MFDSIKRIHFIGSSSAVDIAENAKVGSECNTSNAIITGQEVRSFYESLINEQTATESQKQLIETDLRDSESKQYSHRLRTKKENQRKKTRNEDNNSENCFMQFLKDSTNGNLQGVKNFSQKGLEINRTDQYGWTALMCASFAGHLHIVKYLIRNGADITKRSKTGETASDLAQKCSHHSIYRYITEYSSSTRQDSVKKEKNSVNESKIEQFCDACQCSYVDESHVNSVAHLLETKKPLLDPGYGIPEWNKGYRILKSSGWDEYKGLGRDATGQRYPVRTVLKRDRLGLGCTTISDTPKVTHFKANDINAVQIKQVKKRHIMEDHRKKMLREKKFEQYIRNMFKGD